MNRLLLIPVTISVLVVSTPMWAQSSGGASNAQHSDSIVQMHNEVRAANAAYKKRVQAADKVRNEEVAKARSERDKAIAAAHSGAPQ
jgi:hypothetical protein